MTGIYKLQSPSGKVYIGQSRDIATRWSQYRNHHASGIRLQHALEKYGSSTFTFTLLRELPENVDQDFLDVYEDFFIRIFEATDPKKGYNSKTGGYRGSPTEETRKRISAAKMGHATSEETRRKMSETRKGKKPTKEQIANISAAMKEYHKQHPHSEEFRARVSAQHKGRKRSVESREKMKISNQGKGRYPRSEDTKKKMSEAAKLREAKKKEKREEKICQ